MSKTVGKGTTVTITGGGVASATAIGANLVVDVTPFPLTINTDDITAIDSAAEERAGSLPSWGPARVTCWWDKTDAVIAELIGAGETDTYTVLITRADTSTQSATCVVTSVAPQQASRRGRLQVQFEFTPTGAVTLA